MSFKGETDKTRRILDAVRADIMSGKLRTGDRIKSVRSLAAEFSVSQCPAQRALDALAAEGLIERRRGSGTFVKATRRPESDTIYFLIPNAAHVSSGHETSVVLRKLLNGAISATAPGQLVQPLPVCRRNVPVLSENPEVVDWEALDQIPLGARVFVSGMWYEPIFPFLIERGARVAYLSNQFELNYEASWRLIEDANWSLLTIDRRSAIRKTTEYIHRLGKRRVAVFKGMENEPSHPFRLGFQDACDQLGLNIFDELYHEYSTRLTEEEFADVLETLWKKTNFDALILCDSRAVRGTVDALKRRMSASIPEEIAVVSFCDLPFYLELNPSISSFDFPWFDIGREIVRSSTVIGAKNVVFQAFVVERGSARANQNNASNSSPVSEWSSEWPELNVVV